MEKKTLRQKLGEGFEKHFLTGYLALAMTVLPYCLGRMVYDRITADRTVQVEGFSPSTFLGFDEDKNGTIDRIVEYGGIVVEYGGIAGARMAAPTRRTYTAKDKEFKDLIKVFDQ